MARERETQLHHRDQAVAASEEARVGIELTEKSDRFRKTGRPMILEGSGDQGVLPLCFVAALGERGAVIDRGYRFACVSQETIGLGGWTINGG